MKINTSKETSLIELTSKELLEIEGGGLGKLAGRLLGPWGAVAVYVIDNWDDISEGFNEGYQAAQ